MSVDVSGDVENQVEMEEKTRLINQVLELQHTLEGNNTQTHTHTRRFYNCVEAGRADKYLPILFASVPPFPTFTVISSRPVGPR